MCFFLDYRTVSAINGWVKKGLNECVFVLMPSQTSGSSG